ncbi:hypothetical protein WN51_03387 [Melipona quadrifasciata]|uniref:Uncharacterized protein n=1 Tax=Melipona quadrifasciata TaxID=166423 RepID=A0A0N0U3Z0_9HYME|nr:hypothetical protein WN51_03387 [Melipona quadrifasciata]
MSRGKREKIIDNVPQHLGGQEEKEVALEYAASVRRLRRKPIVRDNAESYFSPKSLILLQRGMFHERKREKTKGMKENKTTVPGLHDPKEYRAAMLRRNYFANARTSTVPSDLDRSGTTERNNRLLRRPVYLGWKLKPARSTIAEHRGGRPDINSRGMEALAGIVKIYNCTDCNNVVQARITIREWASYGTGVGYLRGRVVAQFDALSSDISYDVTANHHNGFRISMTSLCIIYQCDRMLFDASARVLMRHKIGDVTHETNKFYYNLRNPFTCLAIVLKIFSALRQEENLTCTKDAYLYRYCSYSPSEKKGVWKVLGNKFATAVSDLTIRNFTIRILENAFQQSRKYNKTSSVRKYSYLLQIVQYLTVSMESKKCQVVKMLIYNAIQSPHISCFLRRIVEGHCKSQFVSGPHLTYNYSLDKVLLIKRSYDFLHGIHKE